MASMASLEVLFHQQRHDVAFAEPVAGVQCSVGQPRHLLLLVKLPGSVAHASVHCCQVATLSTTTITSV